MTARRRYREKLADPVIRVRVAVGVGLALAALGAFAACGGCRKSPPGDGAVAVSASAPSPRSAPPADAAPRAGTPLWEHAKSGEAEDLATLAAHEGAVGLVEAAAEPELRETAIRAMAYADGWAQLPFLAKAAGGDDGEALLALEVVVDLAARPRTSEEPEDLAELAEGCAALLGLARDGARARPRRVQAVRALRMMPCPAAEVPSDVDSK